jgi:cytochrome P450
VIIDLFPKADLSTGKEDTLSGKFVAGPNLAITNGAKWKSQRMIANPAFRRSMPVKLFGNLTIELFEIIESTDGTVNFSDLIERWTLEAIGKAGFGTFTPT